MRILIDTESNSLTVTENQLDDVLPLYGKAAFEVLSRQWLRVGWSLRYYHNFSWFGHPVLQLPEDLLRLQEVLYRLRPDVVIETGVFHGGSMAFYASIFEAMGHGRVIGIDRELTSLAKETAQSQPLAARITLIEGDSTSPGVFATASAMIGPQETVFVMLDSCHEKLHVARELDLYAPLVTPGSYLVAADGVMRDLTDVPGGVAGWSIDNPMEAAKEFAARHSEFIYEQPAWLFNDSEISENVTYWPGAWLRRDNLKPRT